MDFLPFEIYSAPFPKDKYGLILEIPEYCTQKELEAIEHACHNNYSNDDNDKNLWTHGIDSDVFPNTAVFNIPTPSKTNIIYEHWYDIFMWFRDNHLDADYRFLSTKGLSRESRMFVADRVQGSPRNMRDYPPHTDAGKMMTCIFPLRPVKSVPTMFCGLNGEESDVFIPWKVNHAYLFCSSQYSYHWYSGDKHSDRWVYNYNIFDHDRLNKSTAHGDREGYKWPPDYVTKERPPT